MYSGAQAVQCNISSGPNTTFNSCSDMMSQCFWNDNIWERSPDRYHLHLLMFASTKPVRHVLSRHVAKFLKLPDELSCLQAIVEQELRIARDGFVYSFAAFIEHYGKKKGQCMWSIAPSCSTLRIARDGGPTHMRISLSTTAKKEVSACGVQRHHALHFA